MCCYLDSKFHFSFITLCCLFSYAVSQTQCEPGYFPSNFLCIKCPAGTYKNEIGNSTCTQCEAGTYSNEGAQTCTSCSGGTYSPQNSAFCLTCPAGTFSKEKYEKCTECNAGYYSTAGLSECLGCLAGFYSLKNASSCTPCSAGYYSDLYSSSCSECAGGKYSTEGSSTCLSCSPGTYSSKGAAFCLNCSAGYYSTQGATSCPTCEGGYYSKEGSSSCTKCPGGYYSLKTSSNCTICPAGTYSNTGSTSCSDCEGGTYSNEGSSTCTNCARGYYSLQKASVCTICRAGTYSNERSTMCSLCSAGYTSLQGSYQCEACPAGSYSKSGDPTCSLCPGGTFSNSATSSSCSSCSAGMYSNEGSTKCSTCGVGTYSLQKASYCIECPGGTYNGNTGNSLCSVCSAGTYSLPKSSSCTSCSEGYYSLQNSSSCTKCVNEDCLVCNIYNGECSRCSAGRYLLSKQCMKCEAGYYSNENSNWCSKCPLGTYSNEGSSTCISCISSCKTCNEKGGNCTSCKTGSVLFEGKCVLCSPGYYSNEENLTECKECPSLYYTSINGSISCTSCDSSCKSCDKTNGNCTSCDNGSVIDNGKCSVCPSGTYSLNNKCEKCPTGTFSVKKSNECLECNDFTYANQTGSSICLNCDSNCKEKCDRNTGKCRCIDGYILTGTICHPCGAGYQANQTSEKCEVCPAGKYSSFASSTCKSCLPNSFSYEKSSTCTSCDSKCNGCNSTNGNCTSCYPGYGLLNGKCEMCKVGTQEINFKCEPCEEMGYQNESGKTFCIACNINCNSCNATNGMCLTCKVGYGLNNGICSKCENKTYSVGGVSPCLNCPIECTYCLYTSGECSSCEAGKTNVNGECVPCSSNGNCLLCSSGLNRSERICNQCELNYFLNGNECLECSQIHNNCEKCSQTQKECFSCTGNYIPSSEGCTECQNGTIKDEKNTCINCYEIIQQCQQCEIVGNLRKCLKCFAPYYLSSDGLLCILAYSATTHYNNTLQTKEMNMKGCLFQVNDECIVCDNSYILVNHKCLDKEDETKCSKYSQKTCDQCESNVISSNGFCNIEEMCQYQMNYLNGSNTCFTYKNESINGQINNCKITHNDFCYSAKDTYFVDQKGLIESCDISSALCQLTIETVHAITCKDNFILTDNNVCIQDTNCIAIESYNCIHCSSNKHLEYGKCEENIEYCQIQNKEFCMKCISEITDGERCISMDDLNCLVFDIYCRKCEEKLYKDVDGCQDAQENYPNCIYVDVVNESCFECEDNYYLENKKCNFQINFSNQTVISDLINTNQSNVMNNKLLEVSKCEETSSKGCQRCINGYYYSKGECLKCEYPCIHCYNKTYCTQCDKYSYISGKGKCTAFNDIAQLCDLMNSDYSGCVNCKEGYMRSPDGKTCEVCDTSCLTCSNNGNCIKCNTSYYRTPQNITKYCNLQSELLYCVNTTVDGCVACDNGYYIKDNTCEKCDNKCIECTSLDICSQCTTNYVLLNNFCFDYSVIPNCISSSNNTCSKCADGYSLSADNMSCDKVFKYGTYIILPFSIVILIILLVVTLITITTILIHKRNRKIKMDKICIFEMKRSNIEMKVLSGDVMVNLKSLSFNDEEELLAVDKESRSLLCVGNNSKSNMKVQITTKSNCEKYNIRTEPNLVTLKSGYACEFEVFITPHCTMSLCDQIVIISLQLKSGKTSTDNFMITCITENSSKLDYDEINEEKQIGRGTFGVVYKGTYKGHDVAIKKLKQINNRSQIQQEEFTKEVEMLDKFRCEYIIHFYGAVFIPNHLLMVTEFARFGSINDVMKHKKSEEVDMKMRVKMMIDAAKGISYLHENGILHRDIKPDNFLVFSLDLNDYVNAKLADFGSSRNINILMTNMTFTNGVGTPIYMAPEVLNKEHYKKPADVYSFAVTMYEVFGWQDPYSLKRFKYPWTIADFVTSGNRLENIKDIPNDLYLIINECWEQEKNKRMTINEALKKLQLFYDTE
ncbi:protein serine/threonine kinase, putative [Entamoeba invadens IP1]|uniref:Protein serine/threonine kinase, putative n=1 Tax=Entamoeba invadens IP1 TaxID=370355 RepID=L7FNP8_ENTIV|nr:protein serine/threonine kinase, putative [Entamoeba invadens IP1]ELP94693.1 protein serine/threonine kinase, putative [Entamoeba invadens IP1]|eukprot:XP_004261464.1 protein serine/threonine kinase, putative [Entamoeba invadens IP1]